MAPEGQQGDPSDPGPSTSSVRVGDLAVRVSIDESPGRPLLLIMGLGGNLEMWAPFRSRLRSTRVVAFDTPGTGGSTPPRFPLTLSRYASLTEELLDRLGLDEVDVLGVSWGGALAQQLAFQASGRVRRLILAATSFGLGSLPGRPSALAAIATPRRYRSRAGFEASASRLYESPSREFLAQQAAARLGRPPSSRGYLFQIAAVTAWSSLPFLHRIKAPTLVLAGERDRLVPLWNARVLAARIPRSRLVVVPDGGHLFVLERAAEMAPVVEEFLVSPASVRRAESCVSGATPPSPGGPGGFGRSPGGPMAG